MTRKVFHTEPHTHKHCREHSAGAPPYQDDTTGQRRDRDAQDQPWATLLQYTPSSKLKSHIVPAAHGFAFTPAKDTHFRIIDLHGQQVVDFMSWTLPFSASPDYFTTKRSDHAGNEHFSASYTRYRINGLAPPIAGERLYSNRDNKMFEIVEDAVKCHDMLFMACNPSFYARLGKKGHRSCAGNVAEAMNSWLSSNEKSADGEGGRADGRCGERHARDGSIGRRDFEWHDVHDPFNIFQNTPYYSLKALECSRAGDWIEMKALIKSVVAVSSCPYEEGGFNGGKATEIGVVWEEG